MRFNTHIPIYKSLILTGVLITFWPGSGTSQKTRASAQEVTVEKKLIEGEKYTFLGDWDKAEAIFRDILEDDVQNSAACYELSRTLLATNKTTDALTYIRKAVRIEPDNEWYLLMEADIHEKIGDLHSAMEVYDQLIQLQPKKAQYYEMMIGFCKKTEEPERLLKTLDLYEQLVGVSESITRTRFETLDQLGRTDEALAAINRLTEVYPLNIEYKYLAAAYARKIGKEDKALDYYKKILAISPDDTRAKLALASTEKKEGDKAGYLQSIAPVMSNPNVEIDVKLEELIPYVIEYSKTKEPQLGSALMQTVQQLVEAHPKEAKVFSVQGDVWSIAGKNKEAIGAYQRAVQLNDNVYIVWEQLIALLLEEQDYQEVITEAGKAIDIFPNQAYLQYAAGYAAYKKKHLDEALDHLNEALIMTGKNAAQKINIYNILGMVYDELGNMDKSVTAFESALAINSKNTETLAYYALTLSRRIKQSDKAIDMADFVMEQNPNSGMLQQIIAEVYYNQGQTDKAWKSIQVALQERADGACFNLAGDILIRQGKNAEAMEMWQKALDQGYMTAEVKRKMEEHK
ncbi:MAG TPA: tetratricopeptide repeat protein, partial [Saprospiraceae bacterium]|nr:tetratricopeptide repeat protein [Saprospiraceae bacterium]